MSLIVTTATSTERCGLVRTFEMWVDYYDDESRRTLSSATYEVQALTAKIALGTGLPHLALSIPDGLNVSEITLICQDKETDPDWDIAFEPDDN